MVRMTKALILGGVRSGKSAYAETLAIATHRPKLYIATARRTDSDMNARIDQHIIRRGATWETLEEPTELARHLRDPNWNNHVILVDCLTLWVSNLMEKNEDILRYRNELCEAVRESNASIIMVTNEVGFGGVPMHPVSRQFADEAGLLHQALAQVCDTVAMIVAGLPMILKSK